MVAPFLLGFGPPATVLRVALGAVLFGLALQLEGPRARSRSRPTRGFDYALAFAAVAAARHPIGLTSSDLGRSKLSGRRWCRTGALTASTRFSITPRGLSTPVYLPQTKNTYLSSLYLRRPPIAGRFGLRLVQSLLA